MKPGAGGSRIKRIIFCADGTWNGPGEDPVATRPAEPTNVYKLFLGLAGTLVGETLAGEHEKILNGGGGAVQLAKYLHGVGDSRNAVLRIMGGAFGTGLISRIVRGYTFLSRHYQPGDDIVLVGFSRGAYTVRALAGLIASQGLLAKALTEDHVAAYRWGAMAWYRYRRQAAAARPAIVHRLAEAVADLPAFLSSGALQEGDLVPVDRIKAVAVWDTVGSLGVPGYLEDSRADAFRFCDTRLSPKVGHGLHAVALDEERGDFTPTLWDPSANALQMLFPGAHADVGGGYPLANRESALSDIALQWMARSLEEFAGVRFSVPLYEPFRPDPLGPSHKPWLHAPFHVRPRARRTFPAALLGEHAAVRSRIEADAVVQEPGEAPVRYAPANRP